MNGTPVIIGAGVAGLMAANLLAPRRAILLCTGRFGGATASALAQGGIAAAVGADDSVSLHAADTVAAGAGLCDAKAVHRIVQAAPWAIEFLLGLGTKFAGKGDKAVAGLALGLEAAHSRRRIVHAADATGKEAMRVMARAARETLGITIIENATAWRLAVHDNAVQGVYVNTPRGPLNIATSMVILATGGIGGLFAHTTNPLSAVGSGLAMAARAGAMMRDLEFVQFHPTALACNRDPMPLISEAVRGEGALLVDETGAAFMQGSDLAARDIVARAVAAKYAAGGRVFLDARQVDPAHFPGMFATCLANGIDPVSQPIPVRPAAHYHMGGIAVNAECESSVRGVFAIGEAASTGLHGANRLASNSLLEALVTGRLAAEACLARSAPMMPELPAQSPATHLEPLPRIREICGRYLGISRDSAGLCRAMAELRRYAERSDAALVAWLMARAAFRRQESRGAHHRTDFPHLSVPRHSLNHISELSGLELAA